MKTLFALVDCNNFYVSCERVFKPSLENKPVLVLSNNDGCAISRSNEVKELGIKMGEPFFKVKDLVKKHNIQVFSSNYTLYGDMSQRVLETLAQFTPEYEIYSIDEAFLNLSGLESRGLEEYAQNIRATVRKCTGIPVSIGIAPTKTLAKAANYFSKNSKELNNVCDLSSPERQDEMLKVMPIEKLWGIGRAYSKLMRSEGINSAYDLKMRNAGWIRKHMGVVGLRMLTELQGTSCIDLELLPPPKKGICSSRSFSRSVLTLRELEESISTHIFIGAEKMRKQGLCANVLTVFVLTDRFKENHYANHQTVDLPVPSDYTPELIKYGLEALKKIYREGLQYKKAGIFFEDLTFNSERQSGFFDQVNRTKGAKIMEVMDKLNKEWGDKTVKFAAQGIKQTWKAKFEYRSPRYTTCWDELWKINI